MADQSGQAADETIPAPDGELGLAYANTRYWRGTAAPTEDLGGPEALLRWAAGAERLPQRMLERIAARWRDQPDEAAAEFRDAITLREAIFRCFAATAAGRAPDDKDLAVLNAALAVAPARRRLRPGGWEIGAPAASAQALLAPVLWSAADLLVGSQLPRVRQCGNPACGWLFFDNSKSGNRRWCSMSACGNRAKAHRHYQRQKGA